LREAAARLMAKADGYAMSDEPIAAPEDDGFTPPRLSLGNAVAMYSHLIDAALSAARPQIERETREAWRPIASAPKDGTHILALTVKINEERWAHLSQRMFVVWHISDIQGWSLFPGMGCGDNWLACWQPLDPSPAAIRGEPT
jgi:hypothetical protein